MPGSFTFCNIPPLIVPCLYPSLPLSVKVLSRHIADPHSSSLFLLLGPPGRVPAAVKASRMRHHRCRRRATPPASITLPRALLRRKGGRAAAVECSVLQATPLPPSLLFPRSLPPSSVVVHLFDYAQFSAAVERLLTDSGSSWSGGAGDRPSQAGVWVSLKGPKGATRERASPSTRR